MTSSSICYHYTFFLFNRGIELKGLKNNNNNFKACSHIKLLYQYSERVYSYSFI